MFNEINEGKPPIEKSHIETKHFSSVLLTGNSGTIYIETIPLKRGPERNLNHSCVKRVSTYRQELVGAQIAQSYWLIGLEESIKSGKTAKKALIDASKLSPEEVEGSRKLFNLFMDRV